MLLARIEYARSPEEARCGVAGKVSHCYSRDYTKSAYCAVSDRPPNLFIIGRYIRSNQLQQAWSQSLGLKIPTAVQHTVESRCREGVRLQSITLDHYSWTSARPMSLPSPIFVEYFSSSGTRRIEVIATSRVSDVDNTWVRMLLSAHPRCPVF